MDSFLYSINATVPIFLVMIVGWVIKQLGVIDDHFANVANKYVFKVALPVLLFRDLSKSDFKSQFEPKFVLYCSIVTILMFSLVWIFTELLMKDDTQKGAFIQGSCRSSAAILGMAFIQNMYQSTGMAPLMIVAAVPLFNIFSVIVLTFKAHPECHGSTEEQSTDKKENIKKACFNIVTNPIIIGIVLGLFASGDGLWGTAMSILHGLATLGATYYICTATEECVSTVSYEVADYCHSVCNWYVNYRNCAGVVIFSCRIKISGNYQ